MNLIFAHFLIVLSLVAVMLTVSDAARSTPISASPFHIQNRQIHNISSIIQQIQKEEKKNTGNVGLDKYNYCNGLADV